MLFEIRNKQDGGHVMCGEIKELGEKGTRKWVSVRQF